MNSLLLTRKLLYIAIALLLSLQSAAQEVATQFSFGNTDLLDTYLSPEKYKGSEYRFISDVLRHSRKRSLSYGLLHEGRFAKTNNRSNTGSELSGGYDFSYGVMYRKNLLSDKLRLLIGGMIHYGVGFTYNTRNSGNNPAQGYMSASIGPKLMLRYIFTLFGKEMYANYIAQMPLGGLMFSPNFGQSYYEIFNRGDYDHNIVFTSVAVPELRHQLSLDVPITKRYAIRVGYLGDYRQSTPNNLKQHHYYNAATLGVVVTK